LKSDNDPTEKIQTFIADRLRELRSEMLRFDNVVAEGRKAHESKDDLSRQLEAEQQHNKQLSEKINLLRHNEERILTYRSELEGLNQEIKDTQHECRVAKAEVQRLQQNLQKRDKKLADYAVRAICQSLKRCVD
jgi:chromosome segregation ATPase